MTKADNKVRIVIAITEFTPVGLLWREVLQRMHESTAELLALFVADDRWHRAASLPFTREISRVSGMEENFTMRRARQVHDEAIHRTQRRMQELASEADLVLMFEVLPASGLQRIQDLVAGSQNILIAPSFLSTRPFFSELQKLGCKIELIEVEEESDQGRRE